MTKDTGKTTRAQRGLSLYRDGAVSEHGAAYVVSGSSRAYTVRLNDHEPTCDCPDYRKRRQTCKHGFATLIFAARDRCKRRKRADRRHKANDDGLRGIGQQIGPDRMQANVDRLNV